MRATASRLTATMASACGWGWATNGVLARTRLVPPTLPTGQNAPSLPRQFYRVAVVDTVWALLGNRTANTVLGIPADDQTIPADVLPNIRDQVVIDYLADGPDTLPTASAVLARTPQNMILAVSPVLDGGMSVPTQAGANAHWPAFPAPNSNAAFPSPPASPKDGLQAAWATGNDVVVTIAADKVPDGAHVRIYPRQFVTIAAIGAAALVHPRRRCGRDRATDEGDRDPAAQSVRAHRLAAATQPGEPHDGYRRDAAARHQEDVGQRQRPGDGRTGERAGSLRRHQRRHDHTGDVRVDRARPAVRCPEHHHAARDRAEHPGAIRPRACVRELAATGPTLSRPWPGSTPSLSQA